MQAAPCVLNLVYQYYLSLPPLLQLTKRLYIQGGAEFLKLEKAGMDGEQAALPGQSMKSITSIVWLPGE